MPDSTADPGPSSGLLRCSNILGKIGKLALLEQVKPESNFVWNDLLFPYRVDQLPEDEAEVDGPLKYANEFLEEQEKDLTETTPSRESILDNLRSGRNSPPLHIHVTDVGKLFHVRGTLGRGRAGTTVEKVELEVCDRPPEIFAMKRMRKPAAPRNARIDLAPNTKTIVKEFENERDNMRKCRHHHLVTFHGGFTDKEHFGIIMSPAAKLSLQDVLDKHVHANQIHVEERKDDLEALPIAFGCLLEAVRFLHHAKVKHRDLKPSNILFDGRRVLICDFGSTYNWEPADREESTEVSQIGTRKYKAPEVLKDLSSNPIPRHNSKTDIFSLGCIFLEIHTVLRGKTLDQMAQKIMEDGTNSYHGYWNYASSLAGVQLWLEQLKQGAFDGWQQAPARLITRMLYENSHERDSADALLEQIRKKYRNYIGKCCKSSEPNHSPAPIPGIEDHPPIQDPVTVPMGYSTPRPITLCKIGRRHQDSSSSMNLEYSSYIVFAESRQESHLVIKETCGGDLWTTTRSITIRSPSLQELWLPAYYILVTQDGCTIILDWSDCDQKVAHSRNRLTEFRKVHYSSPSKTNLQMEVEFRNESDARALCALLLKEPTESQPCLCQMQLPDDRRLTIRSFPWKLEGHEKSGSGSHVLSIRYAPNSRQYQRLESLFLPDKVDFTWALDKARKHVELVIKPVWIPHYISDQDPFYEDQDDRATCKGVELVAVSKGYTIILEEDPKNVSTTEHAKETQQIEHATHNFQHFLSTLTGSNLLVAFSITASPPGSWRKRPADVLCFRNQGDENSQLAIRWKEAGSAISGWTTASLVKILAVPKDNVLEVQLAARQDGHLLDLARVTAVGRKGKKSTDKSEKWLFHVEDGSATPTEYNDSLYKLAHFIEPRKVRDKELVRV